MSVPGLFFDWDGDLSWDHANSDQTSHLIRANYTRGSAPEITGAAQAGSATFVMQNPSGLFDPDNASGPLYGKLRDGIPVWFGANEDGTLNDKSATVRGRFAGRIVEVAPLPEAGAGDSTPTVEIICEDALGWYGRTPVALTDDCSPPVPPVPPVITGGFGAWAPGSPLYAVPELPAPTTPGNTLFLVMAMESPGGAPTLNAPTFGRDPILPTTHGTSGDTSWDQVAFATSPDPSSGSPGAAEGFMLYTRLVDVAEVTVTPVEIRPSPIDNILVSAWLWEIEGDHRPAAGSGVTFTTGYSIDEGEVVTVGTALSGFVVGGFCVGVANFGHRITVTATSSGTTTLESASGLNYGDVPTSISGVDPPWTWIASTTDGPLAGYYTAPFDAYVNLPVAGAACVIPGITSLPHINYKGESPPDVTS